MPENPRRPPTTDAEEITEALVAAHRRGIVHRDLKPDNVMITPNRGIKVLDFGIARSPESESTLDEEESRGESKTRGRRFQTLEGSVVGTAAYMSPEQARGEPVTPASDIYSLGVLLEELLSGHEPVPEGTEPQVIIRLVAEERRPKPPPPLPRRFTQLIAKLQAVDPSERPPAAEALAAIRRLKGRPNRILRRSLAAIFLLVMIAGVAKYTVDLREEKQRAQEARAEAEAEALISFLLEDLHEGLDPLGRYHYTCGLFSFFELGQAEESLEHFREAIDSDRVILQVELAHALASMGSALLELEPLEEASRESLERSLEHIRDMLLQGFAPGDTHSDLVTLCRDLGIALR